MERHVTGVEFYRESRKSSAMIFRDKHEVVFDIRKDELKNAKIKVRLLTWSY